MAAEFDGIQVLRVLAVPDTRPGNEGQVALGVMFRVDDEGPFGFELANGLAHPLEVIRRMQAVAREVRSVLLF